MLYRRIDRTLTWAEIEAIDAVVVCVPCSAEETACHGEALPPAGFVSSPAVFVPDPRAERVVAAWEKVEAAVGISHVRQLIALQQEQRPIGFLAVTTILEAVAVAIEEKEAAEKK